MGRTLPDGEAGYHPVRLIPVDKIQDQPPATRCTVKVILYNIPRFMIGLPVHLFSWLGHNVHCV